MKRQYQRCKSCGAEIIWALAENGKVHPINAHPDPEGNYVLSQDRDTGEYNARYRHSGDTVESYRSHYATCTEPLRLVYG